VGYNKIFLYGHTIELYKYDRDIDFERIGGHRGGHPSPAGVSDVGGVHSPENAESDRKKKRADNAKRASVNFKRLVRANLGGTENPLFITLTYKQNITSLADCYRDFTTFVQALRYRQKTARYIAVPEFQKRGAVHFHLISWGVPKAVLGIPLEYPANAIQSHLWRHGFIFVKETDGHARIANYLAKYMAKAFADTRLGGSKAYTCSRNIVRPVSYKGISDNAISYLLDDFLSPDMELVENRSFDTMFLGHCNLSVYKKI